MSGQGGGGGDYCVCVHYHFLVFARSLLSVSALYCHGYSKFGSGPGGAGVD